MKKPRRHLPTPSPTQPTKSHGHTPEGPFQKLAREEAKCTPDIRQNRVDQIRAALQSGDYQVSNDLVAERIIRDLILNESSTQD